LTHNRLGAAISGELLGVTGHLDTIVTHLSERIANDSDRHAELRRHRTEERTLTAAIERLETAIEQSNGALDGILRRLERREDDLARTQAHIERIEAVQSTAMAVSPEQVRGQIQDSAQRLLDMGTGVNGLLRRLIPDGIIAIPYQRIDCDLVVLRAEFELCLAPLVPEQLILALGGESVEFSGPLQRRRIVVDLFEEPPFVTHAVRARELKLQGRILREIGDELGMAKRQAHLATQLGKLMENAGAVEPYLRLTEAPDNASRWGERQAD
jgi:hypothetical protein